MPTSPRKKILLVYPRFPVSFWSFGYIRQIGGFTAVMPPLGLAILAALIPPEFDVEIIDENIEAIDFDAECDVVALSAMAIQEARLFEVADTFRQGWSAWADALDEVNTSVNRFGEGGVINMVRLEA